MAKIGLQRLLVVLIVLITFLLMQGVSSRRKSKGKPQKGNGGDRKAVIDGNCLEGMVNCGKKNGNNQGNKKGKGRESIGGVSSLSELFKTIPILPTAVVKKLKKIIKRKKDRSRLPSGRFMKRMIKRFRRPKSKAIKSLESKFITDGKVGNKATQMSFLKECTNLLKKIKRRHERRLPISLNFSKDGQNEGTTSFQVLGTMLTFGMRVAESMGWSKSRKVETMATDMVAMQVSTVHTEDFATIVFPTGILATKVNDSIALPGDLFNKTSEANGTIVSTFYEAFDEMKNTTNSTAGSPTFLNSGIVSTEVDPPPVGILKVPVKVTFKNFVQNNIDNPSCVFWDYNNSASENGGWSTTGCWVHNWNASHTECYCNHLTDFAVLFQVSRKSEVSIIHAKVLGWISLIGCIISIIGLTLTLLTLLVFRKLLRIERNVIHFNLAAALLIANLIFVCAEKAFGQKVPCFIVTIALFYFFLSAFTWMLIEGVQIWILLTQVFEGQPRLKIYFVSGWGFPLLVVAISAGIFKFDLVGENFCWLSTKGAPIWTFIGPALAVIAANLVVLLKALYLSYKHSKDKEGESSIRTAARCSLILMPILGFTWIFGVFSINGELLVFQYLFTIFNSLQGLFIFLFYVIINVEVRREYRSYRRKQKESQSVQQRLTGSSTAGSRSESQAKPQGTEMSLMPTTEQV